MHRHKGLNAQETLQTPDTAAPKVHKPYHGVRIEEVKLPENFDYFSLGLETMPDADLLSDKPDEDNPENPYTCPL